MPPLRRLRPALRPLACAALAVALSGCGGTPTTPPTEPTTGAPAASGGQPSATAAPGEGTHEPHEGEIGEKDILVVSFISPGDGTDQAAYERLQAMLKALAKPPPFASRLWGKEGEHDECFDLSSLSAGERGEFLARVKAATGASKKVTITEDGTCHEGR